MLSSDWPGLTVHIPLELSINSFFLAIAEVTGEWKRSEAEGLGDWGIPEEYTISYEGSYNTYPLPHKNKKTRLSTCYLFILSLLMCNNVNKPTVLII